MSKYRVQEDIPHYFDILQCGLLWVGVDFVQCTVTLQVPPGNCTDMQGAIRYAHSWCANVKVVRVMAGHKADIEYRREPSGEWKAHYLRK